MPETSSLAIVVRLVPLAKVTTQQGTPRFIALFCSISRKGRIVQGLRVRCTMSQLRTFALISWPSPPVSRLFGPFLNTHGAFSPVTAAAYLMSAIILQGTLSLAFDHRSASCAVKTDAWLCVPFGVNLGNEPWTIASKVYPLF